MAGDGERDAVVSAILAAAPWRQLPDEEWDEVGLDRFAASVVAQLSDEQRVILKSTMDRWLSEEAEAVAPLPPRDVFLLARCLAGYDWDPDVAYPAARSAAAWRAESGVGRWPRRLLSASHWPSAAESPERSADAAEDDAVQVAASTSALWRAGWHGCDINGRPVYIDRTVGMDYNGVYAANAEGGEDDLVYSALAEAERSLELYVRHCLVAEAALAGGSAATAPVKFAAYRRHVVIVDCSGLGRGVMSCVGAFKRVSAMAGANYPDTVHRLLVVNAPWIFSLVFKMVKPFIDPVTVQKVRMLGSVAELFEHVPRAAIPTSMGGSCCCGGSEHCAPCIGPR
jgi:hypothetical protein